MAPSSNPTTIEYKSEVTVGKNANAVIVEESTLLNTTFLSPNKCILILLSLAPDATYFSSWEKATAYTKRVWDLSTYTREYGFEVFSAPSAVLFC